MFNGTEIKFLQRLVAERPETRALGAVALRMSEHFNIGVITAKAVTYRESHFTLAKLTLENHGLPVHALPATTTRAEAAEYGGVSEKTFSSAPHGDSVAVQFVGGCRFGNSVIETPPGAYLVMPLVEAMKVECDRILVVENLEPFRKIKAFRWIDYQGHRVMVVYRGDNVFGLDVAQNLIYGRAEPIWAFMDFDLAGMKLAHHLGAGRLERLLLPDNDALREAADTHRGRELFANQESSFRGWAESDQVHPAIRKATSLVQELQSSVVQERMLRIPD